MEAALHDHSASIATLTPVELVALARLAIDPHVDPPPHLCDDLEAKGLLETTELGTHLLTGPGKALVRELDFASPGREH